MTAPDPKCTCGSGGHPCRCEAHPYGFDLHCAELNLGYGIQEVGLPDDDDPITYKELLERLDEYERQVRAALKWWRERWEAERAEAERLRQENAALFRMDLLSGETPDPGDDSRPVAIIVSRAEALEMGKAWRDWKERDES